MSVEYLGNWREDQGTGLNDYVLPCSFGDGQTRMIHFPVNYQNPTGK